MLSVKTSRVIPPSLCIILLQRKGVQYIQWFQTEKRGPYREGCDCSRLSHRKMSGWGESQPVEEVEELAYNGIHLH
jgi:hypothetical protein